MMARRYLATVGYMDRSEPRLIVIAEERDDGKIAVTYIAADKKDGPWHEAFEAVEGVTPLKDFNVVPRLRWIQNDELILAVYFVGESGATYQNGKPREWQARDGESVRVRDDVAHYIEGIVAEEGY